MIDQLDLHSPVGVEGEAAPGEHQVDLVLVGCIVSGGQKWQCVMFKYKPQKGSSSLVSRYRLPLPGD